MGCVCAPFDGLHYYVDPGADAGLCAGQVTGSTNCPFPNLTEGAAVHPPLADGGLFPDGGGYQLVIAPSTYSASATNESFPLLIPDWISVTPSDPTQAVDAYVIDVNGGQLVHEPDGGEMAVGIDLHGSIQHATLMDATGTAIIVLIHRSWATPTLFDVEVSGGEMGVVVTADDGAASGTLGNVPTAVLNHTDITGAAVDGLLVTSAALGRLAPTVEAHNNVSIRNCGNDGVHVVGSGGKVGNNDPTVNLGAPAACVIAVGGSSGSTGGGGPSTTPNAYLFCNTSYGVEAVNMFDTAVQANNVSWNNMPPTTPGGTGLGCLNLGYCDYNTASFTDGANQATVATGCPLAPQSSCDFSVLTH